MVDAADGVLGIEWIDGMSVRKLLPGGAEDEGADFVEEVDEEEEEEEAPDPLIEFGLTVGEHVASDRTIRLTMSVDELMGYIGTEIAKMHLVDVVHGDLTTSNMMLRRGKKGDLVRVPTRCPSALTHSPIGTH